MDNKADATKMVESLIGTANQIGNFLSTIQQKLSPEQKAELDKHLGGDGEFSKKMDQTRQDLEKAQQTLNNFKI